MPRNRAPYHNKMKTPTKTIAKIAIDIVAADKRKQVIFNANAYIGSPPVTPEPESFNFVNVGPTSVDVGEQVVIDCGEVVTDALNSMVMVNCQNIAGGPVFSALLSITKVAGRITYYWRVVGDNLEVEVYNDSGVDTNVMVWHFMA